MTHDDLVARAVKWMRQSQGCAVVAWKNKGASCIEEPDAVGWTCGGFSTLVECKTSRADFFRDGKKSHRILLGVGARRFFMTPPDLVKSAEVPDGWGLLYCYPSLIRTVRDAVTRTDYDRAKEIALLVWWNRGSEGDPPVANPSVDTSCLPTDNGLTLEARHADPRPRPLRPCAEPAVRPAAGGGAAAPGR